MPGLTGDPIYDVGAVGLLVWLLKEGIIVFKQRGNGADHQADKEFQSGVSDTLAGVGDTMKTIAEHQLAQTDMLKRNDDRHATRGNLCAWSDENPPRDVARLKDVPEKLDTMKQTLENNREITLACNSKLGEVKQQMNKLEMKMKSNGHG